MARPKQLAPAQKIVITTNPGVGAYLDDLARAGLYGSTRAEVAKFFVTQGVADAIGKGIIRVRNE